MKYEKEFDQFVQDMKVGLDVGEKKYGLTGLTDDNHLEMLQEELRDVACYAYLLYQKIEMIKANVLKYQDVKEITGEVSKNKFNAARKLEGVEEKPVNNASWPNGTYPYEGGVTEPKE